MNQSEFAAKLKQQLVEWEADIEAWEQRIKRAGSKGEDKSALELMLRDLKDKRAHLDVRLKEMELSAEAAWLDMKEGVELAWTALKLGFQSAKSEFADRKTHN